MVKNLKTVFLGTTKRLTGLKSGCLFTFRYRGRDATDPTPFIIMISPPWVAKNGNKYFTGVNLNKIKPEVAQQIISEFGSLPIGSVSYRDLQDYAAQDPSCCVRTYYVRNVRALHKVDAKSVF
jgi:hypothetical protein